MEEFADTTILTLVRHSEKILKREQKMLFAGRVLRENLAAGTKEIRDILRNRDKKYFVSFSVKRGKLRWLWISSRIESGFFGDIVYLKAFYISRGELGKGILKRLISNARKYHKAGGVEIYLALCLRDKGAIAEFRNNGFTAALYGLAARTAESLGYLSKLNPNIPAGYKIKPINFGKSLEEYLDLSVRAMKTDSTSATYNAPASRLKKTYRSNIRLGVREKAFGLYFKDKLVGEIYLGKAKGAPDIGLIAGVGILPYPPKDPKKKLLLTAYSYVSLSNPPAKIPLTPSFSAFFKFSNFIK